MALQTVHLRAVAEWCGESARIQLVRRSQPKSSGLNCHFVQTLAQLSVPNPLLHFTENILVQTEGDVGRDERERERHLNFHCRLVQDGGEVV